MFKSSCILDIQKLDETISKIETQKSFRILGYILAPIVIGFFILKKIKDNIQKLEKQKEELTTQITNDLENSNHEIENILKNLDDADAYLIYPRRTYLMKNFDCYKNNLDTLLIKHDIFEKNFNDLVLNSINKVKLAKSSVENFNNNLINRRKKEYEFLFKKSTLGLNDEQKRAIITDDLHNLVVAGAGSGKTEVLTTRIAYLVFRKQESVSSNRILVLAFQKKAAKEIKDRLYERFGIDVRIKTFHSLGLEILKESSLKPKFSFNGDNFEWEYRKIIETIYEKAEEEPDFQRKLVSYMCHFEDEEMTKNESDFETKEDWYKYMQNLSYVALNGIKVKSEGERAIMNFLLSHKINEKPIKVLYENPAEWMKYIDENGETKIPKPDFFLPEYNIYIEHWAVNEMSKVPKWFRDEDIYKKGMNEKIKRFKEQNEYALIQTSFGEFKQEKFAEIFKKKLIEEINRKNPRNTFVLSSMGYYEIIKVVWEDCKESMKRNPSDVATFISKAKTNGFTSGYIYERLDKETWSPKQKAFAEIALIIYDKYEKKLRNANEIDFCDMINKALEQLKENKELFKNIFDHILIDEYQDISKQRYQLIKELLNKNNGCKLFCVGDDWQSIMGFTGSNLEFFVNFEKYFDHPARTDLSINYRSIKSIIDAGADLIKYNGDAQLKKITLAYNNNEKKILIYSSSIKDELEYYRQTSVHCVNIIKEYLEKGYKPQEIMILSRIVKKPRLINPLFEYANKNNVPIVIDSHNPKSISLMSVHKSKGLQAKVVFLLSVDDGLYGFPCKIEDLLIFEPAMENKFHNKEEEERRLFYVAISRAKEDIIIYTQKDNESMFLDEIQNHIDVVDIKSNS